MHAHNNQGIPTAKAVPANEYDQQYESQEAGRAPAYTANTGTGGPVTSQPHGHHNGTNGGGGLPPGVVVTDVEKPRSYCCLTWLSFIFCCWPVGFIAVCVGLNVDREWRKGDVTKAYKYSKLARNLALLSLVLGVIMYVGVLGGASPAYTDSNNNNNNSNNNSNGNNNGLNPGIRNGNN